MAGTALVARVEHKDGVLQEGQCEVLRQHRDNSVMREKITEPVCWVGAMYAVLQVQEVDRCQRGLPGGNWTFNKSSKEVIDNLNRVICLYVREPNPKTLKIPNPIQLNFT